MNLSTKILILLTSSLVIISPLLVKLSKAQTDLPSLPTPRDIPVNPLPVRLPANKDLPTERFLGKEYYQKKMLPGALLQSVEFMSYQEYMTEYGDGASVPSDISPDRMVSVLKVDFPNGLKADNADYSKANVISARDAISGDYLSHTTVGSIIFQKGPNIQP